MDFKYLITLIIPVYNVEFYIKNCLESVLVQTIDKQDLQVLLIDDESTDNSPAVCKEYAEKYGFFEYYRIENKGPANARNFAIDKAQGKYIAYLDSDDTLTSNTLQCICDFFDEHYDEIDEVTYKIVPIEKGVRKKVHFRYDYLKDTGIYDLTDESNIYITQTTMNIAVKNLGESNIKFELVNQHEDQKYNIDVLKDKMKIGYIAECEYLYERNPQSIVHSFNSRIFDESIKLWEKIFVSFGGEIPKYIQALYCNDILWKMESDILLPYHLMGEEFTKGVGRIVNLLNFIDDDVLLNHPFYDDANKYYFLDLKYNGEIKAVTDENSIKLFHNEGILYQSEKIDVTLNKLNIHNDKLEICGSIISPVLKYTEKPEFYICVNSSYTKIELTDSSYSYNKARIKNCVSYNFRYVCDIDRDFKFFFKISVNNKGIDTALNFGEWIAFNEKSERLTYALRGLEFSTDKKIISVKRISKISGALYYIKRLIYYFKHNKKTFIARLLAHLYPKNRIWLYHDCKGYAKDNGYYQFCHDFYKKDGVKRYYVVNGNPEKYRDLFDENQFRNVITLRSTKHKILYLKAEKIITAYIEKINYIPFFDDVLPDYLDIIKSETIYLQHGVLHAHLPWKYSYDRLNIAYEVISTEFEKKNFTENYCFPENALIDSKMPRYDHFEAGEAQGNKILFAPSWRKYLISFAPDGNWVEKSEAFLSSDYFKKTYEFLHSEELENMLNEYDWTLEFKLHPIFSCYQKYFKLDNSRIKFAENNVKQSDYKIFVTDYSSFVFDFVYLNRAIIYFMPDYEQFKCGMNDYKALDIPFEDGFGEFNEDADGTVEAIKRIIKNNGKPLEKYNQKNADFFLNHDKNCCDIIYDRLISNSYGG